MTTQRTQLDSDDAAYVFVELPRCPMCDGTDLKTTRSIRSDDGSRAQRKRCQNSECRHAFTLVWE